MGRGMRPIRQRQMLHRPLAGHLRVQVRDPHDRPFPSIDSGMCDYIMALTGCAECDVPDELDLWMRYSAIGVGVIRDTPTRRHVDTQTRRYVFTLPPRYAPSR